MTRPETSEEEEELEKKIIEESKALPDNMQSSGTAWPSYLEDWLKEKEPPQDKAE